MNPSLILSLKGAIISYLGCWIRHRLHYVPLWYKFKIKKKKRDERVILPELKYIFRLFGCYVWAVCVCVWRVTLKTIISTTYYTRISVRPPADRRVRELLLLLYPELSCVCRGKLNYNVTNFKALREVWHCALLSRMSARSCVHVPSCFFSFFLFL